MIIIQTIIICIFASATVAGITRVVCDTVKEIKLNKGGDENDRPGKA